MKHPVLLVFLTFVILYVAADYFLRQKAPSFAIDHQIDGVHGMLETSIEETSDGIVITADRRGHYSGSGLINGRPMNFIIDTGATWVAVPRRFAELAGLKRGARVKVYTAAGETAGYQTTVDSLQIGVLTIRNARAVIQDGLDTVLVGMSVLKQFKITQDQGKMSIEINPGNLNSNSVS
ncbi:TIGR02281 family clan AA aspartic protease (plasmid) [Methylomarinum sp. Ch1-1]|uniref:TIGR02281 family clan AA aspartic protease n=1 Tax=Methylomarinum roseum TaxID=3067653 RepID=A0AAU7P0M7_9GAMM